MSPIKTELLKALETASDDVAAQTFQYLQSILPEKAREFEPQTISDCQLRRSIIN
jgi:hypothetical protein